MDRVDADYEGGVLRPVKPLHLRPGERVSLIVMRQPDPARWDLRRLAPSTGEDVAWAEAGLGEWSDELDHEDHR